MSMSLPANVLDGDKIISDYKNSKHVTAFSGRNFLEKYYHLSKKGSKKVTSRILAYQRMQLKKQPKIYIVVCKNN